MDGKVDECVTLKYSLIVREKPNKTHFSHALIHSVSHAGRVCAIWPLLNTFICKKFVQQSSRSALLTALNEHL